MHTPKQQELRDFGYLFGVMLILIFGMVMPGLFNRVLGAPVVLFGVFITPLWPWLAACGFWGLSLMWPPLLRPIYYAWMKIGAVLGWINTRLIMLVLFYGIVFPLGLLMRLFGKDAMRNKRQTASYRIASAAAEKNHLERPY